MVKKKDNQEKEIILRSKNGKFYAVIFRDSGNPYVKIFLEDGTLLDFMVEDFFNARLLSLYDPEKIKGKDIPFKLKDKKISRKELYKSLKEFFDSVSKKEVFNTIVAEPGYQKIMDFMDQMERK